MDKLLIALCVLRKVAFEVVAVPVASYHRYIRSVVDTLLPELLRPIEVGQPEETRRPAGAAESALAKVAVPLSWIMGTLVIAGAIHIAFVDIWAAPHKDIAPLGLWVIGVLLQFLVAFGAFLLLCAMPIALVALGALSIGAGKVVGRFSAFVRDNIRQAGGGVHGVATGVMKAALVAPVKEIESEVRHCVTKFAERVFRPVDPAKAEAEQPVAGRCERAVVAVLSPFTTAVCVVIIAASLGFPVYGFVANGVPGFFGGAILGVMGMITGCCVAVGIVPCFVLLPFIVARTVAWGWRSFARHIRSVADQCAAGIAH